MDFGGIVKGILSITLEAALFCPNHLKGQPEEILFYAL